MTIKGKGGKIREIFYKLDTWDLIKDKIGNITYRKISAMTKRVLGKEYAPHSIRRSFATHMLLSGANPKMVMLQMGHTNINTTYRYLNISKEINKDIYNKYI
jgi:integrase/recombinase XerD